MTAKPKNEATAAVVTIYEAPAMTKRGRKAVADWLRQQADYLEQFGAHYAEKRYTARYVYVPKQRSGGQK